MSQRNICSLVLLLGFLLAVVVFVVQGRAPIDAVTVFVRGEGGYYCHKIPYLLRTDAGTLIAMAEGRGRDGREACDDFAVSCKKYFTTTLFVCSMLTLNVDVCDDIGHRFSDETKCRWWENMVNIVCLLFELFIDREQCDW